MQTGAQILARVKEQRRERAVERNKLAAHRAAPLLQANGFLRLPEVLALVSCGKSHWWQMCSDGRAPRPVKLSARVTAWRAESIRSYLASAAAAEAQP